MSNLDLIALGILWDRLIAITDEVVSSLIRTSFSIAVRESYDLSCVLFDKDGHPIAQGSYSVPSFSGTAGRTIAHMFKVYPPETLEDGDVVATNDPWIGTGHLYDINVMRPIFHRNSLVGYSMSITHLPDVGGNANSALATEIYEEGLRLPVFKIVKRGVLNDEMIRLIRANVRVNDLVIGDIMANIACNEVCGRLLREFMDEYGIEDLTELSNAIRDQSDRIIRDRIRQIPDGVYTNSVSLESADEPIRLACAITKSGGDIAFDFSGTSGTVQAGLNVPYCYTCAWTSYSVKCLICPEIPNNEGQTRILQISAPLGCILNALPPSPTAGRHSVGHFIVPMIFGALADVLPDRVQADSGMMNIFNVQGRHPSGAETASLYFLAGGLGASDGADGPPTRPFPSNMRVVPTEVWERSMGVTIEHRRLLPDSGGAGRCRGGVGQEVVFRNDSGSSMILSLMAYRTTYAAQGARGGRAGALRRIEINGVPANPKGRYVIAHGDRITIWEAGGGGYGPPTERSRDAVRQDIEDGFVSADGAWRDYNFKPGETS